MRKTLSTSAAGFIGSHLCERLLLRGCRVICVGNFFTGQQPSVAHLIANPAFKLYEHDMVEPG